MEQNHYFNIPTQKKFEFEELEFTPINVEFYQRLYEWHKKDFDSIQQVLSAYGVEDDAKKRLEFFEIVAAMIHTATHPYVEEKFSRDIWKKMVSAWVLTYPDLVTWFLEYLVEFMPTSEGKSSGKKSKTPGRWTRQQRVFRWTGVTSSDA